ncbi:MAG: sulfatase [Verrucomicrobia bacterium]|nr:sulfatase [Verrucomicrobiota bacterium]MDA1066187.1 sulfatase [Verrucomicrobiota bacterium]
MNKFFLILLLSFIGVVSQVYPAPPNFVMFITDDHGVCHSNPYGADWMRTPHMQSLADDGLMFTRAYVVSPSCAPSRAALCTGLMPYNNGIVGNHENIRKDGVEPLLPILAKLGYEIAWYGKVGHGNAWYSQLPEITMIPYANKAPRGAQQRLDITDVENFIKNRKDASRPLALFVGNKWPHRPWPEPETARISLEDIRVPEKTYDTPETRSEMTRYIESIERVDNRLGEVRTLIREYLDQDNTLIVYTADHGHAWPFGKWSLYETGVRTPLIAVWPGKIKPGTTTRAMVSWIDIIPTFIDVAGEGIPWKIDGRSFKNVLLGKTDSHRDRIFAVQKGDKAMSVYPIRSVRTEQFKYILNLYPEFYYTTHMDLVGSESPYYNRNWPSWIEAAKTDPEATAFLRAYHERPPEELYLVESDPFEKTNLVNDPSYQDVLIELRGLVADRMKAVGDDKSLSGEPRYLKDHPLP